jgi:F-type H+-transporting ATPase subunit b
MTSTRRALLALGILLVAPSVALAAGDGGHGPNWKELGSQIVNFGVYVALIVFLAKKPVLAFFEQRRAGVTAAMDASAKAAAEAQQRLAETREKLDAFDAERQAVLDEFRAIGESERTRIVAQAEADAAKILREAEMTAEREVKLARAALEARMVDQALQRAESEIRAGMTADRQAQLIDSGIAALASAPR